MQRYFWIAFAMLASAGCGGSHPGMVPTDGGSSMMDGGSSVDARVADGGTTPVGDGGEYGTCLALCHELQTLCPYHDDVSCLGLCASYIDLAPSCTSQSEAWLRCEVDDLAATADAGLCDSRPPSTCRELKHAFEDCMLATSDDPYVVYLRNRVSAGCPGSLSATGGLGGYSKTYLYYRDCEDERQAFYRCAIDHPCDADTVCSMEYTAQRSCEDGCGRDDCGRCLVSCDLCVPSATHSCGTPGTCVVGTCACPSGSCFSVNDNCVANDRPSGCGASCTACPWPANGSATCTAGVCGAVCDPGYTYDPASHTCA